MSDGIALEEVEGADLTALLRATPGVTAVYPAPSTAQDLLAALATDPAASGAPDGTEDAAGRTVEVSVGLDGTVPAPEAGRRLAAVVAAGVPEARRVTVRIVGFD